MLILSKPTATLEQCLAWAKSKKAPDLFIELVPKLYSIAEDEGVNPVLVVVQCAKETGYCKFGGVLDASFKNTCGLKTTQGGSCDDPNAHTRFNTWEDGITAQVEHLALYAGKDGYPLDNPIDPRHHEWLLGTAPHIRELNGKWCSGRYGDALIEMMTEVQNTVVEENLLSKAELENQILKEENSILKNKQEKIKKKLMELMEILQN